VSTITRSSRIDLGTSTGSSTPTFGLAELTEGCGWSGLQEKGAVAEPERAAVE
jgi:hypothetical protein